MKIAIWHENYISGGSDHSLADLVNSWPKNDKFTVFCNISYKNLINKFSNINVSNKNFISLLDILNYLKKNYFVNKILEITIIKYILSFFISFILFIFFFFRINKKYNFVIINNGGYPGGLTSFIILLICTIRNIKNLLIVRNYTYSNYKKNIILYICRIIINYSGSKVVTVSKSLKRNLIKNAGLKKKKIVAIYDGIDIKKRVVKAHNKISIKNKYSIGIIGRIEHRKGHHLIVKVWAAVLKKIPHAKLYIIGSGDTEYIDYLNKRIKKMNISNSIVWISETRDIFNYIKKINLIVMPSLYYESYGRVSVEAMAMKKLILSSNCGGLKEIVKDGYNGFNFRAGNAKDLLKKIFLVFKEVNKKKIIKNAYNDYIHKYSSDIMSKNYLNLIENSLER